MERHNQALANTLYQQPNDLTKKNEKPPVRLESLSDEQRQGAMLRLWNRMRGIFGTQWAREFGDIDGEQAKVWMDALGGLTLDQIKNGIEQSMEWSEPFPPKLNEFMRLCLTTKRQGVKPENQKYLESRPQSMMPSEVMEVHRAVSKTSTQRDHGWLMDYNKLTACRGWGRYPKEDEIRSRR